MHDILIIGGGPAGLTAAIYALRAGKTVLVLEKGGFGGQIAYSPKVENIPGFPTIGGSEFADKLTEQALALGADVELACVTAVEQADGIFRVTTEDSETFDGRSVIVAVGVKHRTLGLDGEDELIGNGISFCAVCDGAFYAGQDVAMIGGGNSAMQEALLLSEVCRKVTIVQNLATFTGEAKLAEALAAKGNVEVLFNTVVTAYNTTDGALSGLTLRNDVTGKESAVTVDGAFLAVGLVPENGIFASLATLDERGYFAADESCCGSVDGVFVAGDCRGKAIRQVVTAAGDGAVAAMAACRYLDN